MKIAAALFLVLLSACRCEESPLFEHCPLGTPCLHTATGPILNPNVAFPGICHVGQVTACTEDGPVCEGELLPYALDEVCGDRLDNDCDGLIDDLEYIPSDPRNTCPAVGVCLYAYQRCIDGLMVCTYTRPPSPEECNCLDDDCDGEVDEDFTLESIYYPVDEYPGTVGVGPCTAGVKRCTSCVLDDRPPVTPVPEVSGNCIDDNCNGLVDENSDEVTSRSFVIVFDRSGSMYDEMQYLTSAVCSWSTNALSADTRFAVIYVGYGTAPYYIAHVQDFADAATTCSTLQQLVPPGFSWGNEYMLEGIALAAPLDWPPADENWVLAFGDETIQLYDTLVVDIEVDCFETPYRLGVFANASFTLEWTWAISSCAGFVEAFINDAAITEQTLREHFAGAGSCE